MRRIKTDGSTLVDTSVFLGHVVHELVRVLIVVRQAGFQQCLDHISVVRFHGNRQRRAPVVQRFVQFGAELLAQIIQQFTAMVSGQRCSGKK